MLVEAILSGLVGTVNVRVTKQTHQQLGSIAKESDLSMQTMIDKAVDTYRKQAFLEGLNADFATLRSDPDKWAAEIQEREFWIGVCLHRR